MRICFRVKGPHLKVRFGTSDGPLHLTWFAGPPECLKIRGRLINRELVQVITLLILIHMFLLEAQPEVDHR